MARRPPSEQQDMSPHEPSTRAVMVFSNAGHTCTHMFTVLYATAVLYLPGVFDLPYGELLGLASVGLILYGVAALPAGWLGDRWSQVGMMVVFFLGIGAGAIVTGLASGPGGLLAGLTLIGLFGSIYHPVGIAWLVASARRQGFALGVNGVFGNVGSALAPVFVGAMIDLGSWRAAFVVPGIAAMLAGVALALAWSRGVVRDERADRAPAPAEEPAAMWRVFFVLSLTMCCNGIVYTGLTNTMPKVFEGGLGPGLAASYTEVGLFVGAVMGLSSFASIGGGWLCDRYSPRIVYVVFWLLLAPALFLVTSFLGVGLLLIAFLALALNVTFAAAENMLVARYTPFRWRAIAYGAKFVLALGIGGLTVRVAGEVFDRTGSFDALYAAFGVAALVAGLGAMALPRQRSVPAPVPAAA